MNKLLLISFVLFVVFLQVTYTRRSSRFSKRRPIVRGNSNNNVEVDGDEQQIGGRGDRRGHHGRHHGGRHGHRRHGGHHGSSGKDCPDSKPNCAKCCWGQCRRCKEGFFGVLTRSRSGKPVISNCTAECPEGTVPTKRPWMGNICVKNDCAPNCGMCLGNQCVKCANGAFTVPSKTQGSRGTRSKTCVTECPKGSKPVKMPWRGEICTTTDCAPNCGMCLGNQCVKCANGTFTVPSKTQGSRGTRSKTCVTECPKGSKPVKMPWRGEICATTDCSADNCDACVNDRCIRCADGTFAQPNFMDDRPTVTCETNCQQGFKPETTKFGGICRPERMRPGIGKPLARRPGMGKPFARRPGMGKPLVRRPGMGNPFARRPGMGKPIVLG